MTTLASERILAENVLRPDPARRVRSVSGYIRPALPKPTDAIRSDVRRDVRTLPSELRVRGAELASRGTTSGQAGAKAISGDDAAPQLAERDFAAAQARRKRSGAEADFALADAPQESDADRNVRLKLAHDNRNPHLNVPRWAKKHADAHSPEIRQANNERFAPASGEPVVTVDRPRDRSLGSGLVPGTA